MSEPDTYLIQVAVPEELARVLKAHAALAKIFLADLFVEAIERFIYRVHAVRSKGYSVPSLYTPRTDTTMMNMRIPGRLARRLKLLAHEEDFPVRRLAYTALIKFAIDNHLMRPLGTVGSDGPVAQEEHRPRFH